MEAVEHLAEDMKSYTAKLNLIENDLRNHILEDRKEFSNLMAELKVIQKLLGWLLTILGLVGSATFVGLIGHYFK